MQTLAALVAEPMAALVDTMWVGRLGALELAACAAAASIFNLASKLINVPLTAVTTSLVAAASPSPPLAAGKLGLCTWMTSAGGSATWALPATSGSGTALGASAVQQAAVSGALSAGLAVGLLQGTAPACSRTRRRQ